ncbi:hypothetical protein ACH35V_24450 [Actinomadura sp. 1N219]|uniref:hypothetical protein n=1 Tax=Actinomadura sp. 1N219 TaxID=3375152 RepID=UPI0037A1E2F0
MIKEEFQWMTRLFERVFGKPPATTRYVLGTLPLLDGLDVPLPWGSAVAAGRSDDGTTSLFSMNHHDHGVVTPSTAPDWARDSLKAMTAPPGIHLVVNRELPADMGLLTGAETTDATTRALQDLQDGTTAPTTAAPARGTCDLTGTDLRLLLIDVGTRSQATVQPTAPETAKRAAAALADRPSDLGPLLTDAHTPGNPTHDETLKAALDAGALGGRTIGTCVATLAPAPAVPAIRKQVTARLAPNLPRPPRYLTAG